MSSSDEAKSALEENINRKGANSYYYAHGKKIDGPVWDGKEEPRLLSVSAAPAVAKKASHAIQFDSFSWLDETKNVKIFVDFENASDIPDADITLTVEDGTLEFRVTKETKTYVLLVTPLQNAVESASFRKKSDKFVLVLKKPEEVSWYQLKKTV